MDLVIGQAELPAAGPGRVWNRILKLRAAKLVAAVQGIFESSRHTDLSSCIGVLSILIIPQVTLGHARIFPALRTPLPRQPSRLPELLR
jgi:hypothetical protein